jgi:hypothetical protein
MNRDRPLALYVYTKKSDVIKLFKGATHSGGLSVNDCLYHCSGVFLSLIVYLRLSLEGLVIKWFCTFQCLMFHLEELAKVVWDAIMGSGASIRFLMREPWFIGPSNRLETSTPTYHDIHRTHLQSIGLWNWELDISNTFTFNGRNILHTSSVLLLVSVWHLVSCI